MDRRTFLRSSAVAAGALTLGPGFWRRAFAAPANSAPGPYGALAPPDINGIALPPGFTSRIVAKANMTVPGSNYPWHIYPDGGATFALSDGGWIYVSNSELPAYGGVGALRFASNGNIVGAHRVIAGTSLNCAGGPTPWGTWLTCEEHDAGHVWECDPRGINNNATALRQALGTFKHEAAAVDPIRQVVYLSEDQTDGRFYRFLPNAYPNLGAGTLQAATLSPVVGFSDSDPQWNVTWATIPNPNVVPGGTFTRQQVPSTTPFNGGEGLWYDSGHIYLTTKGDNRVWDLDVVAQKMSLVYDDNLANVPTLTGVDNVTVSSAGELVVAEDGGDMQLVLFKNGSFSPLLQIFGQNGSEITGPAFSPDGSRIYFSSQRGGANNLGLTYEVRGPFNTGTFAGPVLDAEGGGLLSTPIHTIVEPPVRELAAPVADVVHMADRLLKGLGL